MHLDLTRYRQPVSSFDRTFQPGDVSDEADMYRVVAPVHLAFEIHKDKDKFRLVGTLTTELELSCSRCLDPFRLPVSAPFDLRYLPAAAASTASEQEVEDEDLETSYYTEDSIDLREMLREQFYLVLPMKPLCQEGCRGLCPQCGTNLNTGTCTCDATWQDPRLAALKDLKTRES